MFSIYGLKEEEKNGVGEKEYSSVVSPVVVGLNETGILSQKSYKILRFIII